MIVQGCPKCGGGGRRMTYLCGHIDGGVWCKNEVPVWNSRCDRHPVTFTPADDGPDEDRHEYDDRSHLYQH